jgi:two-component system, NtrC family, sensor histidine kinase AtoS
LAFGRPRPPQFEEVELHELIEETVALLRRDDRCSASIAILSQFDPSLPKVRADRDQLRQVFWNLLLNAVQALGEGGEVRLETRRVDGEVKIRIRDTGPGIPATVLPKIFDPFFTTRRSGTGLGLAIVRRIMQDHGGHVAVDTHQETGACLVLSLPHAQDN